MSSRKRFSRFGDWLVYGLYLGVGGCLDRIPLAWTFRLGQGLGWLGYVLAGRYRRLARRNVQIAFPTWSEGQVRACVRQHFQTLGANLLCTLPLSRMRWEKVRPHVDLTAFERRLGEINAQKAFVGVVSHIGNWELMIHGPHWGIRPGRHGAIYQRLRNPLIDAHVRRSRESGGLELIDRSDGLRRALGILREGGTISILVDQHAGDQGIWTPFFGRLASTTPFPAILAKKAGAVLMPLAVYTAGLARWRVEVEPFIDPHGASIEEISSQINEVLAEQIRRSPGDWFWVHRRWKTPSPRFLLRSYRRGIYVPAAQAGKLRPFRIMVRSSNWLGDAVMTVPAVRAIKAGRPDAHLTVLTRAKLEDFWESVPGVDEVFAIRDGESVWSVARRLREKRFEVAVLLPNSPRSGLEAWLARIPRRVGYARRWRTWCLNHVVPEEQALEPPRHQAERYLRLAERIGADLNDAAFDSVDRVPEPGLLALCPGAEYGPAKRWPFFAGAARALSERHGFRWVVVGTAKDRALAGPIVRATAPYATDLTGKTSLSELMDVLRRCQLLLTNDTGTMHLAAYLGVPTVAIFGSTEPALTGPLGEGHVVVRRHVECSPCFLRVCPIDFRCMHEVTVAEVVAVVERRLGVPCPSGDVVPGSGQPN
ncbi:MAG: lipopolysaccharide heptosyltransferase II [Verrucomicrobia bacterium]|nr:lipopolysaccharide heptosyltransferase II [Verrucomicrobiota bacterium]